MEGTSEIKKTFFAGFSMFVKSKISKENFVINGKSSEE